MSLDKIKKLREITSVGINDCRKALTESNGDFDKALTALKKRGVEIVEKKKGRKTLSGLIESYVHFGGNLGSLVEINCETDFVAKNDVFRKFAKDIAMHIAATNPKFIGRDDIPEQEKSTVKNIDEYIKESCLLEQMFVKDNAKSIAEYLKEVIAKTGENIVIRRFSRFSLGENED